MQARGLECDIMWWYRLSHLKNVLQHPGNEQAQDLFGARCPADANADVQWSLGEGSSWPPF